MSRYQNIQVDTNGHEQRYTSFTDRKDECRTRADYLREVRNVSSSVYITQSEKKSLVELWEYSLMATSGKHQSMAPFHVTQAKKKYVWETARSNFIASKDPHSEIQPRKATHSKKSICTFSENFHLYRTVPQRPSPPFEVPGPQQGPTFILRQGPPSIFILRQSPSFLCQATEA